MPLANALLLARHIPAARLFVERVTAAGGRIEGRPVEAQLIANITDVFGVELSLLTVFDDPTVRGISAAIEQSILEKLENMSEDEAQRLLAANGD